MPNFKVDYENKLKAVLEYLDGNCTLEDSIENLKQNTRHYAKRQLTWFRRNPELNMDY